METQDLKTTLPSVVDTIASNSTEVGPYTCPHCGREVPPIVVELLGKVRKYRGICPCVAEREKQRQVAKELRERQERAERIFSMADLGPRFADCTFGNWIERPGTENLFFAAKEYANTFDQQLKVGSGLVLRGNPGTGKTHAASAIVNHLITRPQPWVCVFRSVPSLLKKLQSTFGRSARQTEREVFEVLQDADLLVLDDMGAEQSRRDDASPPGLSRMTAWAETTLYLIVDERYRAKKPLVVTTNCTMDELAERIRPRTMDRLLEMCLFIGNEATSFREERADIRLGKVQGAAKATGPALSRRSQLPKEGA